jgi:hypothetical protein
VFDSGVFVNFQCANASRSTPQVRILAKMRERLGMPAPAPGSDAALGLHGLRAPGYYILALHFRRIPLGFEPLSVMLNEKQHKEWRMNHLAGFWETGEKFARKAAEIARCRNQTLLIYFATDDAQNLRPIAKRRWSPFGRVVFGPLQREIGHMSPQWTQKDLDAERERDAASGATTAAQQQQQQQTGAAGSKTGAKPKAKMEVVIPTTHNPDLPVRTAKSEHAVRRHAVCILDVFFLP